MPDSNPSTTLNDPALLAPAAHRSWQIATTAGYYLGFIGLGLAAACLGPTLPLLAEQTRSGLSLASILFTASSVGYVIGCFLGGRLYDWLPGHRLIPAALLLMAFSLALIPGMTSLWALSWIVLLLGLGQGTLDVGANTLLVWVHRSRVGPFMNGLHLFFGVGALIAPAIIAQSLQWSGSLAPAFWILSILMLPAAAITFFQPSPRPEAKHVEASGLPLRTGLIALIVIFFFFFVGSEVIFGSWIATYGMEMDLVPTTSAAYLASVFWAGLSAGRLAGIPIAARFDPRRILFADLLLCLAATALILLWPRSIPLLWVGTFLVGAGEASLFPATLSLAERNLPIVGKVTSWFFLGSSCSGIVFPWVVGQLLEPYGARAIPSAMFAVLGVSLAVFAAIVYYLRSQPPKAPAEGSL